MQHHLLLAMLLAAVGLSTSNLTGQVPARADKGTASQAQPRSSSRTISGVVLDPSGASIASANISLMDSDSKSREQASTDNNGAFCFGDVAPGKYTLEFKAEGLAHHRKHDRRRQAARKHARHTADFDQDRDRDRCIGNFRPASLHGNLGESKRQHYRP